MVDSGLDREEGFSWTNKRLCEHHVIECSKSSVRGKGKVTQGQPDGSGSLIRDSMSTMTNAMSQLRYRIVAGEHRKMKRTRIATIVLDSTGAE